MLDHYNKNLDNRKPRRILNIDRLLSVEFTANTATSPSKWPATHSKPLSSADTKITTLFHSIFRMTETLFSEARLVCFFVDSREVIDACSCSMKWSEASRFEDRAKHQSLAWAPVYDRPGMRISHHKSLYTTLFDSDSYKATWAVFTRDTPNNQFDVRTSSPRCHRLLYLCGRVPFFLRETLHVVAVTRKNASNHTPSWARMYCSLASLAGKCDCVIKHPA